MKYDKVFWKNRAFEYAAQRNSLEKEIVELKAKYKSLLNVVDNNWLNRDHDECDREFWDEFKLEGGGEMTYDIPSPEEYMEYLNGIFYAAKKRGKEAACNNIADQAKNFALAYDRQVDYHLNRRMEQGR